ncbi:hypothetical protein GCM10023237_05330 [Streptomyces coeruleoprunus]
MASSTPLWDVPTISVTRYVWWDMAASSSPVERRARWRVLSTVPQPARVREAGGPGGSGA